MEDPVAFMKIINEEKRQKAAREKADRETLLAPFQTYIGKLYGHTFRYPNSRYSDKGPVEGKLYYQDSRHYEVRLGGNWHLEIHGHMEEENIYPPEARYSVTLVDTYYQTAQKSIIMNATLGQAIEAVTRQLAPYLIEEKK